MSYLMVWQHTLYKENNYNEFFKTQHARFFWKESFPGFHWYIVTLVQTAVFFLFLSLSLCVWIWIHFLLLPCQCKYFIFHLFIFSLGNVLIKPIEFSCMENGLFLPLPHLNRNKSCFVTSPPTLFFCFLPIFKNAHISIRMSMCFTVPIPKYESCDFYSKQPKDLGLIVSANEFKHSRGVIWLHWQKA